MTVGKCERRRKHDHRSISRHEGLGSEQREKVVRLKSPTEVCCPWRLRIGCCIELQVNRFVARQFPGNFHVLRMIWNMI
jgi:hypothetical protein